LQREFAQRHRGFNPVKIAGASHFPTLESPDKVVMEIRSFIG
jgi:pimeloyl-ACP methyl ester carboxylesterase